MTLNQKAMIFYNNQLFHIYNQGNNRQQLFFREEHYLYFLWKMRAYLLPYGDFITWCLMPNHFHWQFFVKRIEIEHQELKQHVNAVEFLRRQKKFGPKAKLVESNLLKNGSENDLVSLNDAIGFLERGYTRALNKEQGRTGSLFRKHCKAKDGWIDEFVTLEKPAGNIDFRFLPGNDYAFHCSKYIHNNPPEAGLVEDAVDWPFSSARDYANLRKGTLCNLELGRKLMDFC